MKKLLQKVDRIRASGMATLKLESDSPYFKFNGRAFKVQSMDTPDYKCRITLLIEGKDVDFTIDKIT